MGSTKVAQFQRYAFHAAFLAAKSFGFLQFFWLYRPLRQTSQMKLNVARDWHTDEIHPGKCENVWPGNLVTIEMRQRATAPGSLALAFTLLSLSAVVCALLAHAADTL